MLKIVNRTVPDGLRRLGYTQDQIAAIVSHTHNYDTIEDVVEQGKDVRSGLKPEHLPVFDCAFKPYRGKRSISYLAHLRMMGAAQPFISLVFETLTRLDDAGRPAPNLATEWQQEGERRWKFQLRGGLKFSEGITLSPALAAQSLRLVNPNWNVRDVGEAVVIETDEPASNLPALLALPRNAIVLRNPGGSPSGTGPFVITDWQPARRLVLTARDDGWQPRPFLDSVEIQFNPRFVGNGRQVQHRIGGAAQRHISGQGVLKGFIGHDIPGLQILLDQLHTGHAGFFGQAQPSGFHRRDGPVARQRHAQHFT
jgi:ABC-type transport system substrate-binding protein